MIGDSHVHFFSPTFVATLARQKGVTPAEALGVLGWDDPVSVEALADRWVTELDRQGVSRAAIIASVPADERSVIDAATRHPSRLAAYFMLDPTAPDAPERTRAALAAGARGICLFPAMHRYSLRDDRVARVFETAATRSSRDTEGPASGASPLVFVHCGVLSVGARTKLGLPSPFDLRLGHPLDLQSVAAAFPSVPIVIPHFGAGMLREALMLADVCPNVYLDTSSSNGWLRYHPGLTLEMVFRSALDVVGPSRILFGTDSSFFPRGWHRPVYERQQAALDALGVAADAQTAIFGGNLARMLERRG